MGFKVTCFDLWPVNYLQGLQSGMIEGMGCSKRHGIHMYELKPTRTEQGELFKAGQRFSQSEQPSLEMLASGHTGVNVYIPGGHNYLRVVLMKQNKYQAKPKQNKETPKA